MCVLCDLVTPPLGIYPWRLIQKKTKSYMHRDVQCYIIYKSEKQKMTMIVDLIFRCLENYLETFVKLNKI